MDSNTVQSGLLIVQIVTLIAIIVYVWKTWAMADATRKAVEASEKTLNEMKLTREEENRPYVIIYFQTGLDGSDVELIIKNIGKLQAKDVRFEFDRVLEQGDWNKRNPISKTPKFTEGIQLLPPNLELKEFFADFVNLQGLTSTYKVKVNYKNPLNDKLYVEDQVLEWKSLEGKLGAGNAWYRLAQLLGKELSEIRSLLEKLSTNKS